MMLSAKDFKEGIRLMPLPCIDFVVINEYDEVLVGKRMNRPAQGYLFAPGGRIRKNETQAQAIERLAEAELGIAKVNRRQLGWLGIYDHLYEDHFYGTDFGTHCIALAYVFMVEKQWIDTSLKTQHSEWQWIPANDIASHTDIHHYTKAYVRDLYGRDVNLTPSVDI